MKLIKAINLSLGEIKEPVVTHYHLGLILHRLYKNKVYKGEKIAQIKKIYANQADFAKNLKKLKDNGILKPYKGLSHPVYSLLGRDLPAIEDVACTIDPFTYVSHLSAMAYHGLTDRNPTTLFLSSPNPPAWKTNANKRMESDLGDDIKIYRENKLPLLTQPRLQKIGKRTIHHSTSTYWGAYKNVRGRSLRVATIGQTFLDMLQKPTLCGGINHVLDVFEEHGKKYLRLIINEVDRRGKPIDKVRAGYILDERLGLRNEVINSWVSYAQRGGSRKLDASEEYIPEWSDKWLLSINVFQ